MKEAEFDLKWRLRQVKFSSVDERVQVRKQEGICTCSLCLMLCQTLHRVDALGGILVRI